MQSQDLTPSSRRLSRAAWGVLAFDYRGIGASRAATAPGAKPTLLDWAEQDIPACVAWVRRENAPIEYRHVRPADYGLERLRHFGFFKRPCRTALWPEMLAWLDAQAAREGRKL